MKRAAGALAAAALAGALGGCGETTPQPQTADLTRRSPPAPARQEGDAAWSPFHSPRLRLSVPLPDASTWTVDDRSRPELAALQEGTGSRLVVSLETEGDLVNHDKCEARAIERRLVPAGMTAMRTVEDTITVGPEAFDTHVRVAVEGPSRPDGPITGHVLAFGAYVKKCLFLHLATTVPSSGDETVLSDRLVLGRLKMLGGLRLDELGAVPRAKPEVR